MNKAEKFVYSICQESFLSLWSFANPKGKNSKELCDVLVVCEPDIIIFSVKDIKLKNDGGSPTDGSRWKRKAIEESIKQIFGAERWIKSASHVIRKDGSQGIPFPKGSKMRIYRVAVALGSQGKVPMEFGLFNKRFVHVFDEKSFFIILNELDTVSDFIQYLNKKEKLVDSNIHLIVQGEENLLATYLRNKRSFPKGPDLLIIDNSLWEGLINEESFKARKTQDKVSYVWDNLLKIFCQDTLHGNLEFGPSLTMSERSFRTMAREDRFSRRLLGKAFWEFLNQAGENRVRSRMLPSLSNITYVFLAKPHGTERNDRLAELGIKCHIARCHFPKNKTVVGIATEKYEPGKGFSLDLFYIHKEKLTKKDRDLTNKMQNDLGFFSNPLETRIQEDEYPQDI